MPAPVPRPPLVPPVPWPLVRPVRCAWCAAPTYLPDERGYCRLCQLLSASTVPGVAQRWLDSHAYGPATEKANSLRRRNASRPPADHFCEEL
jgi:hypothetical protein